MVKNTQAKTDIAQAANDALKVIANAAAEAIKVTNAKSEGDHDLIIEIKTIQQTMLLELREIKDGTSKRISDLENEKLSVKDSYPVLYKADVDIKLSNLDKRTGNLETNRNTQTVLLTIGSGILALLTSLLIWHLMGK